MFLPILRLLARAILMALAGLAFWAVLPILWGWQPTTVMSDSMAPAIRAGDVVVTMPLPEADLRVGQVLLADDPDHDGRARLHRLVGIDGDALITKGDANPLPDSSRLDRQSVRGVGIVRVPWLGSPALWLQTGSVAPVAILAAGLLGLTILAAGPVEPTTRPGRRNSAIAAGIAGVTIVALVAATAGPAPSWAALASTTGSSGNGFAASSAFDCLSRTPSAPAFLFYAFGEPDGSVVLDSSGNGRNGTMVGGASRTPGSCAAGGGPALALDGSTGMVTTPTSLTSPGEFTLELWVRTTTTAGTRLVGFGSSQAGASATTDRVLYLTGSGQVVFGVATAGSRVTLTSNAAVNDGGWHLIGATLAANGAMKLFVDGANVASRGALPGVIAYPGYWRIGADDLLGWPDAPSSPGATTVDDIAIHPTALNHAQIAADYSAGR